MCVLLALFAIAVRWHSSIASLATAGQRHVLRCIHKSRVTYAITFKTVASKMMLHSVPSLQLYLNIEMYNKNLLTEIRNIDINDELHSGLNILRAGVNFSRRCLLSEIFNIDWFML